MSRTLASPLHRALVNFLIVKRKEPGLTQAEVAARLDRYQSFVATLESGQRRADVVDLIFLADAIGFDSTEAVAVLKSMR